MARVSKAAKAPKEPKESKEPKLSKAGKAPKSPKVLKVLKKEKVLSLQNEFVSPSEDLKHVIQYIQVFHFNERNKETTFRVFPEGSSGLVYNYGNPHFEITTEFEHKRDNLYIRGQFEHYTHYKSIGKTNLIIVKFTPLGGFYFLDRDMKEFLNLIVPVRKYYKNDYQDVMNKMKIASDDNKRIQILESYIREKVKDNEEIFNDMEKIINKMVETKGRITIPELATLADMSISSLEKKFNKYVGFNPKTFCRIQTMKSFFEMNKAFPDKNLYSLALECGYHDQSHFIKDFKKFTGISPRKYLKSINEMGFKSVIDEEKK